MTCLSRSQKTFKQNQQTLSGKYTLEQRRSSSNHSGTTMTEFSANTSTISISWLVVLQKEWVFKVDILISIISARPCWREYCYGFIKISLDTYLFINKRGEAAREGGQACDKIQILTMKQKGIIKDNGLCSSSMIFPHNFSVGNHASMNEFDYSLNNLKFK